VYARGEVLLESRLAWAELFVTSSEDGTGIEALRAHLAGFALPKTGVGLA